MRINDLADLKSLLAEAQPAQTRSAKGSGVPNLQQVKKAKAKGLRKQEPASGPKDKKQPQVDSAEQRYRAESNRALKVAKAMKSVLDKDGFAQIDTPEFWCQNLRFLYSMVKGMGAQMLVQDVKAMPRVSTDGVGGQGHVIQWFMMSDYYRRHEVLKGLTTKRVFGVDLMWVGESGVTYRDALLNVMAQALKSFGQPLDESEVAGPRDYYDPLAELLAEEAAEKQRQIDIANYVPPHLREAQ